MTAIDTAGLSRRFRHSIFLIAAIFSLAACGGGGGGGGGGEPATPTHTVSTSVGIGGSINPESASVTEGESTQLSITPDEGYLISSASGCEGTLSGNTYTTGEITANCTVEVSFSLIQLTITTSAGDNGSISPSSPTVDWGSSTNIEITPNAGYAIASYSNSCGGTPTGDDFSSISINTTLTADCSVSASFIKAHTINIGHGPNGSVNALQTLLKDGNSTTIIIDPADGYAIETLVHTCDGIVTGDDFSSISIATTPTSDCSVSASFIKAHTITTTPGANGTIVATPALLKAGDSTEIVITPASGYAIATHTNSCGGTPVGNDFTSYTYNITPDASCSVTAEFVKAHTITTIPSSNGTITATPDLLKDGVSSEIVIDPDAGYAIASHSNSCGGIQSGDEFTALTYNAIPTADCSVTAEFIKTHVISTSVTTTDGEISTGAVIKSGAETTISVTPFVGYAIDTVTGCDVSLSTGNDFDGANYTTGNVTADCTVTASFIATHNITASAGTGGSIDPTSKTVKDNLTTIFTVSPSLNYGIQSVTGTGCGVSLKDGDGFGESTYETTAITADCSVTAVFKDAFTITAKVGTGNGSISPLSQPILLDETHTFTVTPDPSNAIDSVTGCGVTLNTGDGYGESTYTTAGIFENCTITANFIQTFVVDTTAAPNGTISPDIELKSGQSTDIIITPADGYAINDIAGT
ncbi:MAG: hypothetical protein OEY52_09175, partial [Gammaproteobacteria bacterium]|nr:hypothetical protein [Gammaproteobacteria bacterium]